MQSKELLASYNIRIDTKRCLHRIYHVGLDIDIRALVMAKKETHSSDSSDGSIDHDGQGNRAGASSRPTPEDGLRLIHAFMDIKEAAIREAIIRFITELSSRRDDKP
jgi:hypothetical protein